ncbi:MAG: rhomboid family intramembrane serine protease [Brevinematales bacterium]|nr:rhomboid family intramembrane serine protease [Brevinematales bacterium]
MIPIKDENPTRSFPFVNTLLIIANIGVFLYQVFNPEMGEYILKKFSMIPMVFLSDPINEGYRLISYSFLHGGWLHLIGNMLFLYIFGDNVEDVFGHFWYLIFYLLTASLGLVPQLIFSVFSDIPIVGASGAISGVILSYMLMFPLRNIVTLMFFGFFIVPVKIPAIFYIAIWIISQISGSFMSIIAPMQGGVAYLVHLGGLIIGFIFTKVFLYSKSQGYKRI